MPSYTVNLTVWADDASIGTKPWVNPGNAEFVDTACAAAASPLIAGSHYLVGSVPTSFSPGVGEILDSIDAVITKEGIPIMPPGTDTVTDQHFYLVVAGTYATAIDKASGAPWVNNTLTPSNYSWSKADLATLGITLADCSNPGFGVVFSCTGGLAGGNVDAIVLTINTVTPVILHKGGQLPPYSTGRQIIG